MRSETRPEGRATMVIDPWTQRWAVLGQGAEAVLTLADGSRTREEIIDRVVRESATDHLRSPETAAALLDELRAAGLLFVSKVQHRSQGYPVAFETEPQGLHLEITNACNLSCTHCYVSSGDKLPNELTDAELRAVVDQLPPYSNKLVAITGGEAAIRRGSLDLVEYCAVERGHRVDLYTNAYKFPAPSRPGSPRSTPSAAPGSICRSVWKVPARPRTTRSAAMAFSSACWNPWPCSRSSG